MTDDTQANPNIHAIIHKPYDDIKSLVSFWNTQCEAFAVAQHDKDKKIPRIHCHILIINPFKKKNAFNDDLKKFFPGINGRSDFRLYITTQKEEKPITKIGLWYLLKGQESRLKFQNNFSKQEVEGALAYWQSRPSKGNATPQDKESKVKEPTQREIVQLIREKLNIKESELLEDYQSVSRTEYLRRYEEIMEVILNELDRYGIRTGMYDIERWFITVVRRDAIFRKQIKDKVFSKLSL